MDVSALLPGLTLRQSTVLLEIARLEGRVG